MDSSKPLDGEVATADEVAQAVQALTDGDYVRLVKAARIKLGGTAYASAEDLVNEAVVTPFRAARGEGGRRWRKDVSFIAFLIMTIRGIASDSRRSATLRRTVSAQRVAKEGEGERDVFDALNLTVPSVEEQLLDDEQEQEREARNQKDFAAVDEFFRNDDEIQWIMIGIQEQKSPTDIQEISGMSKTQYESAQRRWRRGLEKLFPGRRKS